MADTGFKYGGSVAAGNSNPANQSNVLADDTSYSNFAGSDGDIGGVAPKGFDFSAIGDSDTIDGIEIEVGYLNVSNTAGDDTIGIQCGIATSSEVGSGVTSYPFTIPGTPESTTLANAVPSGTLTFGGAAAKFGHGSITATQIKHADFSVILRMSSDIADGGHTTSADFDFIRVKVYYTAAGGGGGSVTHTFFAAIF